MQILKMASKILCLPTHVSADAKWERGAENKQNRIPRNQEIRSPELGKYMHIIIPPCLPTIRAAYPACPHNPPR
jgi:hypothetical protein